MNIQGGRKLAVDFKASETEISSAAGIKFAFTGKKVGGQASVSMELTNWVQLALSFGNHTSDGVLVAYR